MQHTTHRSAVAPSCPASETGPGAGPCDNGLSLKQSALTTGLQRILRGGSPRVWVLYQIAGRLGAGDECLKVMV